MENISQAIITVKNTMPSVRYSTGERMSGHTTFQIGGPVHVMYYPVNAMEMAELYNILREHGVTPLIIGNGSNILADDGDLDIIVIKTTGLQGILINPDGVTESDESGIMAESGVSLSKLAGFACGNGLAGLEFAYGIPGTLGGAVLMNAGAYGGEIKDIIISTKAFDVQKGEFIVTGAGHCFSHRESIFSNIDCILLSSVVRLRKDSPAVIKLRMDDYTERRRERQPLELPSAGSIFKRPNNGHAAQMIEQAGLKGYTVGGAQVSEKHAGFIVNKGGATFSDVISVISHIQETIFKLFGVELEPEVRIIKGKV